MQRICESKLRADLQQYYNVCLDDVGAAVSLTHAAALAAELPSGSRVKAHLDPYDAWTNETYMLSMVEFRIHQLAWMLSEDGQVGRNKPELLLPIQKQQADGDVELLEREELDRILGIKKGEYGDRDR